MPTCCRARCRRRRRDGPGAGRGPSELLPGRHLHRLQAGGDGPPLELVAGEVSQDLLADLRLAEDLDPDADDAAEGVLDDLVLALAAAGDDGVAFGARGEESLDQRL